MSTSTAAATAFAALDACFTADLTTIIGSDRPQHDLTPTYLVEEARDVLGASSHRPRQEAGKDLAIAAIHLTGALTAPADVQSCVLARARTHLRDAISAVH
ncbi:hypothetical protein [Streptomyces griseus]|uniref:hypothetical protein n=1 Tax=Streptomyces griseus TaxID=1911 RepID=UPI0004C6BDA3|nr:hypothetical protein [Streptomyces griseus]